MDTTEEKGTTGSLGTDDALPENLQSLQYYLLKVIKEASFVATGAPLPPEALEKLSPQTITFAAIIVSTLPIVAVYPFLMKYFESGILLGSLKG